MKACFCGAEHGSCFEARETLFAEEGTYLYRICENCGAARLVDSSRGGVKDSYGGAYGTLRESRARLALRCLLNTVAFRSPALGETLGSILPFVNYGVLRVVRECRPGRNTRLLDVGCGVGRFLRSLRCAGFKGACSGVDPFLSQDRVLPGGIDLVRGEIHDVRGRFDIITLVHVLEHSPVPVDMLRVAGEKLRRGGRIVITVPIFGGTAWRRYGPDWVQLDAPRHVYLHTRASLAIAADAAGLRIERELYDSTVFQFWGSDIVRQRGHLFPLRMGDLALLGRRLKTYLQEVAQANREGLGDQETFVLEPS